MEQWSSLVAAVLSGVLLAAVIFYVWGRRVERRAADTSQRLILAAKEELMSVRENLHKSLDQKLAGVDRREADLHKTEQQLQERARGLDKREQGIGARLEQVAGLTAQDAKLELVTGLENAARDEAAALVRNITEQAKKNADREAKKIIALAIQRIAAEQTAESSVSAVLLPSDEMKGRIIGREGRNIRAFEKATETKGGKTRTFSNQGRTVVFELKKDKYWVGVVGKPDLDQEDLEKFRCIMAAESYLSRRLRPK